MAKGSKAGKYGSSGSGGGAVKKKASPLRNQNSATGGGGDDGAKMAAERRRRGLADPLEQQDYPPEERKALYDYTYSSHINWELGNKGYDNLDPTHKKMAENLDKAIAKSGWNKDQDNTPFSRGCGAIVVGVPQNQKFSSQQDLADYINKNCVGGTFTNVGYTSITHKDSVASGFKSSQPNPIVVKYDKIGKGMKGAYVSGGKGKKPISYYGEYEYETLLQRNVKTTPVKAYVKNGTVYVHVIAKP